MAKKKLYFYTMAIIFIAISTLALLDAWGTQHYENNGMEVNKNLNMMGQSMGNMMASMHLKNITIRDLLPVAMVSKNQSKQAALPSSPSPSQSASASTSTSTSSQNHHTGNEEAAFIPRILTGTILVLMPFIVAGAIFLSIVWFH